MADAGFIISGTFKGLIQSISDDSEIGIGNHPFHTLSVLAWSMLPKSRTFLQPDKLVSGNGMIWLVTDSYNFSWKLSLVMHSLNLATQNPKYLAKLAPGWH